MANDFMNIDLEHIDLAEYDSMKISFSKEEKENIKKSLRKKITKRKSRLKRSALGAIAASVAIAAVLFYNGGSVVAKVLPVFDKIYVGLGFKPEYLPSSAYIGKTYEENGVKVTLENIVVTKHVIKVALKTEYGDKWSKSKKPLVFFGYKINGEALKTGSFGGSKNIDKNTELKVLNFPETDREYPSKLNFKIEATSDAFSKSLVWDIKGDFSKNFEEDIEKQVTMSKDIGINIKHIEANPFGAIIGSNKWMDGFYLKIDNKIYPIFGGGSGKDDNFYTFVENINYNTIKDCNNISVVKHTKKEIKDDVFKNMTKEENIAYCDKLEKEFDKLPKKEDQGIIYTKETTFKNGKKAEIYNVERKGGKLHVYIKGDDKKQVFSMLSHLYTSTGIGVQSIEDTGDGYCIEFDDISKDKVTIKMEIGILDCDGDYSEEESKLILK
ncbi:DUF4179 domain-containing protein [Clostridium sp. P21]|uniref:DUF4179 domain-containing protein n=1 Tax=Clostridium muellerianum TaxID=2716538 RepID=A0A7Y0HPC8_9CLOT|nr:DUF4179 domain-containing protein [Clostridium muellerianum]NMM62553.1 DUF4179 domain-containing protein [Clostridium muellerianum]